MNAPGRPRPLARLAVAVTTVAGGGIAALLLAAGPAAAVGERGTPGGKLSAAETLAIFVGAPVAVAAIIAFLVVLPSMVRGPRYRPGRPWTSSSHWFGEPAGGEVAAEAIIELPPATIEGGGASARW